ncbi:DoxX family protein [Myxococcota bacterium]|nr:DoxX family protein [Myxococcota bacterium]
MNAQAAAPALTSQASVSTEKTTLDKIVLAVRILTGLIWVVFGLNGFLHFIPMPPLPSKAGAFMGALAATGYMFPLIKGTEILGGLLLLSGRFTPIGLVLLAPVAVNILAFHLFLAPAGTIMPLLLIAGGLFLAWQHRDIYAPVLGLKN